MARTMTFKVDGAEYAVLPFKVDRKKLYGWSEVIAVNDDGIECKMVSMDETGTLIIPKGGMGSGIVSPEMEWVERSSLKAIRNDGSDAAPIKSSYSGTIELTETVNEEEFLDHNIVSVYQLEDAPVELTNAVGSRIFTFVYSYRDSFKGESAFILVVNGVLFMLLGYKAEYEMLSLSQAGAIDETDLEDEEEDSDELDFSMV